MIVKIVQKDDGKNGSTQYFEGNYIYSKLDKFDAMGSSKSIYVLRQGSNKAKDFYHIIICNGNDRNHVVTDCRAYLMNENGKTVEIMN